jgi:hypothetical protein
MRHREIMNRNPIRVFARGSQFVSELSGILSLP